jgi:hypothetical protein
MVRRAGLLAVLILVAVVIPVAILVGISLEILGALNGRHGTAVKVVTFAGAVFAVIFVRPGCSRSPKAS